MSALAALDSIPRYRQRLDWVSGLNHPVWVVEGVENGQFAMICKAHHCMVAGVVGVALLQSACFGRA